MMNEIDGYLNEMCWAMGGSVSEQQAVRDELRDHIADAARDLEMQGVPQSDAARRAMSELGGPEPLGRALRASRRRQPVQRPLLLSDGTLVVQSRRPRHLPHPVVVLAIALSSAASSLVVLGYLWPA